MPYEYFMPIIISAYWYFFNLFYFLYTMGFLSHIQGHIWMIIENGKECDFEK